MIPTPKASKAITWLQYHIEKKKKEVINFDSITNDCPILPTSVSKVARAMVDYNGKSEYCDLTKIIPLSELWEWLGW